MYKVYQVKNGDTLDSVARKANITVDQLKELNGIMGLSVGEYIIIPRNENDYFDLYVVQNGDSLYSIARDNNIDIDELVLLNGLNKNDYIYPNQQLLIPKSTVDIYITKPGDTLETIIDNFNTDYSKIMNENTKIYLLPEQLIINKKK